MATQLGLGTRILTSMLGFEIAIYGSPEKKFLGDRPPPLPSYLRVWMTRPPPLSQRSGSGIDKRLLSIKRHRLDP